MCVLAQSLPVQFILQYTISGTDQNLWTNFEFKLKFLIAWSRLCTLQAAETTSDYNVTKMNMKYEFVFANTALAIVSGYS